MHSQDPLLDIQNLSTFFHTEENIVRSVRNVDLTIYPGETTCINLQIQCEAFVGPGREGSSERNMSYYLYPRSSLAKTPLRLANSVGIIDAGYRGNICAFVDNIKDEPYRIDQGTRLFQICSPTLEPIEYTIVNALSETTRGSGGFGSTGR